MKKWLKIAIPAAVALAVGGGALIYRFGYAADAAAQYKTTAAVTGEVSRRVVSTGAVKAKEDVSYYIDTPQTVSRVPVKVGDGVRAGDTLVEYDITKEKTELERRLKEAEINLANSQLNLQSIVAPVGGNDLLQYDSDIVSAGKGVSDAENSAKSLDVRIAQQKLKLEDAQISLYNAKILLELGDISQVACDQAELNVKSAQKTLDDLNLQRKAALDTLDNRKTQKDYADQRLKNAQKPLADESAQIRYDLEKNMVALNEIAVERIRDDLSKLTTSTVSTANGYVSKVNAVSGAEALKGTAVVTVSDMSALVVTAEISEYDAPLLAVGQAADITTSGLPDKIYAGEITKIAAGAVKKDSSSASDVIVPVEITVLAPDDMLKPGYTVDVDIFVERRENALRVPVQAVTTENGEHYVYVLDGKKPVKTRVTTGLTGARNVEILTGLSEGDLVVTEASEVRS